MGTPLDFFQQLQSDDWLVGYSRQEFADLTQQRLQQLSTWEVPPKIFLTERNPVAFLASFIAACAANSSVYLGNPDWTPAEQQQVLNQIQPDLVWADVETRRRGDTEKFHFLTTNNQKRTTTTPYTPHPSLLTPHIMIPTGGSSGKIRFAIHTWETLMASVQGFRQYFGLEAVNSFCVLPLYHVSGLMQCLRSLTSGGKLVVMPFKSLETQGITLTPDTFCLSLVPTQLQRLLSQSELIPWLSRFQTVLLGGAPAWTELLETARSCGIRLAPTYGMTETASQVATLKPEDFLQGTTGCGQALPHAQILIRNSAGVALSPHQIGMVTIRAQSLALGYAPNPFQSAFTNVVLEQKRSHRDDLQPSPNSPTMREFQTDDLGFVDEQGYLHIIGRASDKIISGGENIFPTEVETAIRATGLVQDVCVFGLSDRHWGEAVTALYVPAKSDLSTTDLQAALTNTLSKFKYPKHWIAVKDLPRNEQGKINRSRLKNLFKDYQPTAEASP